MGNERGILWEAAALISSLSGFDLDEALAAALSGSTLDEASAVPLSGSVLDEASAAPLSDSALDEASAALLSGSALDDAPVTPSPQPLSQGERGLVRCNFGTSALLSYW